MQGTLEQPLNINTFLQIEYVLVKFLDTERRAVLNLEAENLINLMAENQDGIDSIWHPEYAKFMLECKLARAHYRFLY